MRALGKRLHPDLPELNYVEVATGPAVIRTMDEGGIDLAILDGEATPTGGMGIAKQLKDELETCPPILVLTGSRDDAWLGSWTRAEASVPHPTDTIPQGRARPGPADPGPHRPPGRRLAGQLVAGGSLGPASDRPHSAGSRGARTA